MTTDTFEVIGVVHDLPNDGLASPVIPEIYLPFSLAGLSNLLRRRARGEKKFFCFFFFFFFFYLFFFFFFVCVCVKKKNTRPTFAGESG